MSIFMLGLPIGIALSYVTSSFIAHAWGWRAAFFLAGVPGVICAIAAMFIDEPPRGMADNVILSEAKELSERAPSPSEPALSAANGRLRTTSPWRMLLTIPTMWWLIVSGALHNFNMYALGSFFSPFLMRFHGADLRHAGLIAMSVYGLSGIPGLLIGGALADSMMKRRKDGRLIVGMTAIFISIPFLVLALRRPAHDIVGFAALASVGCMCMYVYYSSVYATIHDVVTPALRGTAMAIYFFAMYVLGASLGPIATGTVSDHFTRRAAAGAQSLEPFRGEGLHTAMYLIPSLSILLAAVLFFASRTVAADMEKRDRYGTTSS
jgi:sugar phosphate permease